MGESGGRPLRRSRKCKVPEAGLTVVLKGELGSHSFHPKFSFLGQESDFTLSQARVRHQFLHLQTGTSQTLLSAFLPGPLPRIGLEYSI